MTKRNKIIYWVVTIWLSLGMVSTGIVQFLKVKEEVDLFTHLGYPIYFLTMLSIWRFFVVVAVLSLRFQVLKEWAYAGFFFAMSGAIFSHIVLGDSIKDIFGPLLLLTLTVVSWYFRPAERKVTAVNL